MIIRRILVDFSGVDKTEKNISITLANTRYNVCVLPVLNSNKGFVSIFQDGEPLVTNRAIVLDEPLIGLNNSNTNGNIDFIITADLEDSLYGEFDINRLGEDLFLYYIGVDEDEV